MALKQQLILINEFKEQSVFNDGVIKITKLNGNKDNIQIEVSFYKSDETYLKQEYFYFTPNLESSDNFIKQAYEYLKTLDEFKDAKDC